MAIRRDNLMPALSINLNLLLEGDFPALLGRNPQARVMSVDFWALTTLQAMSFFEIKSLFEQVTQSGQ